MNKVNLNEPNKDDAPWYGRLILGIVIILFIIFTFFFYFYIIDQLACLVPSWMDGNFRRYLPGYLLFYIDRFHSLTLLHLFPLHSM